MDGVRWGVRISAKGALNVRRYFQFSLRSLLLFVSGCALFFSWVGYKCDRARHWMYENTRIQSVGGLLLTKCELDEFGRLRPEPRHSPMPPWLVGRCPWCYFLFNDPVGVVISQDIPCETLGKIHEMQYVVFAVPGVTDSNLANLRSLVHLRRLYLDGLRISDRGITYISGMRQLQVLDLRDTHINGGGFPALNGLVELRDLDLSCSDVTDAGLASLPSLPNLRRLRIAACGNCDISDRSVPSLLRFRELEVLDVGCTAITNAGVKQICSMRELKKLSLTNCRNVDDGAIEDLKLLTRLKYLCIWETRITPQGQIELQNALPNCKVDFECEQPDELFLCE